MNNQYLFDVAAKIGSSEVTFFMLHFHNLFKNRLGNVDKFKSMINKELQKNHHLGFSEALSRNAQQNQEVRLFGSKIRLF